MSDYEKVDRFVALDKNGQDLASIVLGEEIAQITVSKWPKYIDGNVSRTGSSHTVTMSRHSLIGLAYVILYTKGE